jgi:CubicO group peptidase (beta-lactamase class C family)/D-alanyl-D-alanine dipeptidase
VTSRLAPALALALALAPRLPAQAVIGPSTEYALVAERLSRMISREVADKRLPALSIALVDDQKIVWARGFGYARPEDAVPATAATVYRVGSVSKLFTDIAVMQLVERGVVDLDAPITRYLPDFAPQNPFGTAVTLRHLMTHRAGLVREPPLGSYFDSTAPPLAATIASLNGTTLVYEPEQRSKYSNAGVAAVGYVLERLSGEPFARYVKRAVLDSLGLEDSGFEPTPQVERRLAGATMWAPDGRRFPAPTFELGIAPAGSLYATVTDLGRFLAALFAGGRGARGRIATPETLRQMWTPQLAERGAETGFGLGFFVSRLDGRRRVGHDGAIYGFATTLAALPDDKLGVVVVTTLDAANSVTERVADAALRAMRAVRERKAIPEPAATQPLQPAQARRLTGRYARGEREIELRERGGELFVVAGPASVPLALRLRGDTLVVDDPTAYGATLLPIPGALLVEGDTLVAQPAPPPDTLPSRWAGLVGEYGWDYDVLFVYERGGVLHALIEWFFPYPLRETSDSEFTFPATGLYHGERLVFRRDSTGRATAVAAAGVLFPRRAVGPGDGQQLRVAPVRPIETLRREARAATPPVETGRFRQPDLVDLAALDSTLRFDIRYATTNNFLGTAFYTTPRAFLQRPAAEALVRAHHRLRDQGYGVLVHDAYRPWHVTKVFWEATPRELRWLVADPSRGSRHNRGCAVDVTLYELATGQPVDMGGTYDEATPRSFPDYPVTTARQRWHREVLRLALEAEGLQRIAEEWWHFDYRDWQRYSILNRTFEELIAAPRGAGR